MVWIRRCCQKWRRYSFTFVILLFTSGFASESTSKLDLLDSRIRIRICALNGQIHWIWIRIQIRQIEHSLAHLITSIQSAIIGDNTFICGLMNQWQTHLTPVSVSLSRRHPQHLFSYKSVHCYQIIPLADRQTDRSINNQESNPLTHSATLMHHNATLVTLNTTAQLCQQMFISRQKDVRHKHYSNKFNTLSLRS